MRIEFVYVCVCVLLLIVSRVGGDGVVKVREFVSTVFLMVITLAA